MGISMEFERFLPRHLGEAPLRHANMRSTALWRSVALACMFTARKTPDQVMGITACDKEEVDRLAVYGDYGFHAIPKDVVRLGLYIPNVSSKHIQQTSEKSYLESTFGETEYKIADVTELNTVIQIKNLRLLAGAWMRYHLSARTEPSHRGKSLEMNGEVIEVAGYGIRSYRQRNFWEFVGIRDWAWDEKTQENIFSHEVDLVSGTRRAFRLEGWRMNHPWSGGNVGQSK